MQASRPGKRLAILGATGSIGVSTLDIVTRCPDQFDVVALSAGKNLKRLVGQLKSFRPSLVSVAREGDVDETRGARQASHRGVVVAAAVVVV